MAVVFVGVGSNVAPEENIFAALEMLKERVTVRGSSTFYRTAPVGGRDQPAFVNGVWRLASDLQPVQIRSKLLAPIEDRLGRVRMSDKYADRTIDLDLVLYNDLVVDGQELTLPHPDISRPFVHGPILELLDDAANEIEEKLLTAIRLLLPDTETMAELPGEPLGDLTTQLRQMVV